MKYMDGIVKWLADSEIYLKLGIRMEILKKTGTYL
jgi:hypothetical protein